jgi:hypothetical protein
MERASSGGRTHDRSIGPAPIVAVVVITLIATYRAFQPIWGDQALAMHIGGRLGDGEVMYLDVWDIRQPLSFYWYALVGWTLGGSALALRAGELIWNAVLAWLIAHDVARQRGNLEAAVTSIAAVGPLFWMMRSNDVAQPDTLAALPVYLVFRAALLPGRDPLRPPWPIVFGVSTVALALVKVTLAPLPFLFMAVYVVAHRPRAREVATAVSVMVGVVVAGAALVVAYFVGQGDWAWVSHTWFEQGPAMRSLARPRPRRLLESWMRLAIFAAPVIAGAAVGLRRLRGRDDPIAMGAACWVVTSALLLLPQQWWVYHWLSLTVPLGLLAGRPLTALVRRRAGLAAAVIYVVGAMIVSDRDYARALIDHGPDTTAIARELQPATRDRDEARAFLERPDSRPGDVYVFGNPLILLDLGREQRLAIHGWSPEFYDETTWARLGDEFESTPPAYVIVDSFSAKRIHDRAPELERWLAEHYDVVHTLPSGAELLATTD